MVVDNQMEIEGPVQEDQIKGILTAFVRNGHRISVKNPVYMVLARIWLGLRPVRCIFWKMMAGVRWLWKKNSN